MTIDAPAQVSAPETAPAEATTPAPDTPAAPEAQAPATPADPRADRVSKGFIALAKKHAKLEARQKELDARDAELRPILAIAEEFKRDPVSAVRALARHHGVSYREAYNALTEAHLHEPDPVQGKIEVLEAKLSDVEKRDEAARLAREAEERSARIEATEKRVIADYQSLLDSPEGAKEFPLARELNRRTGDVAIRAYQVAVAEYRRTAAHGRPITLAYGEALGKIEAELASLRSLFAPSEAQPPTTQPQPTAGSNAATPPAPAATSLTNATASAAGSQRPLTWREKRALVADQKIGQRR